MQGSCRHSRSFNICTELGVPHGKGKSTNASKQNGRTSKRQGSIASGVTYGACSKSRYKPFGSKQSHIVRHCAKA